MYRKHAPSLPASRSGDIGQEHATVHASALPTLRSGDSTLQHPSVYDESSSPHASASAADAATSDVLDVPAVAKLLAVGRNTVYALVARNQIPHRRFGRCVRFSRAAIMRWLDPCWLQDAKERQ